MGQPQYPREHGTESRVTLGYTEGPHSRYYNREGKARNSAAAAARGKRIIEAAKAGPCADCGIAYPPHVMDFDHVRGVKLRAVGLLRSGSVERLLAEIAKCEVVCSNCHRERTHQRRIEDSNG